MLIHTVEGTQLVTQHKKLVGAGVPGESRVMMRLAGTVLYCTRIQGLISIKSASSNLAELDRPRPTAILALFDHLTGVLVIYLYTLSFVFRG